MQKRTLILSAVLAGSLLCGGLSQAYAAQTYSAAMDAAYPPFGSQDLKTREYVGYDVDIIKAIAKAIHRDDKAVSAFVRSRGL